MALWLALAEVSLRGRINLHSHLINQDMSKVSEKTLVLIHGSSVEKKEHLQQFSKVEKVFQ